jgi:hypothetical protein
MEHMGLCLCDSKPKISKAISRLRFLVTNRLVRFVAFDYQNTGISDQTEEEPLIKANRLRGAVIAKVADFFQGLTEFDITLSMNHCIQYMFV